MDKRTAKSVVAKFKEHGGPQLTVLEAMAMVEIPSDSVATYAIRKEEVVFLAQRYSDGSVDVSASCW